VIGRLLLERAQKLPRTHDIVQLLNRVKATGSQIQLDLDDTIFLNSIYSGRYPTDEGLLPQGEPTGEDAERALKVAGAVMQTIDQAFTPAAAQIPEESPERQPASERPVEGSEGSGDSEQTH